MTEYVLDNCERGGGSVVAIVNFCCQEFLVNLCVNRNYLGGTILGY